VPWRRKDQTPPPEGVNVNDRLARLRTEDLHDQAEASLMMAGYHLSEWRNGAFRTVDIDSALMQAEFAVEALRALRER
jgi:hypothetical protein